MLIFESTAPAWALRGAQRLSAAFAALASPQSPRKLPEYAATADLPDPTRYRACDAYVTALVMTVFSDGTIWRRSDTGAIV
jgi:hypothetical protein